MSPFPRGAMAQAIADALEVGIWLTDGDGHVLYRNPAAARFAPEAKSLGDLEGCMVGVPFHEYVGQVRAGATVVTDPVALLRGDDRVRKVELQVSRGPASLPGTLLLTMIETRSRLRPERVRALREISSVLNHRINDPLAILSGEIEMMNRDSSIPTPRIERMQSAVRRVADVLARLRRAAEPLGGSNSSPSSSSPPGASSFPSRDKAA